MTSTADRLRLYEHARETWDEPTARTLVDLLPADLDHLATKGDLTSGLAQVRAEMHEAFAVQTRTIAMWMISMTITFVTFSVGAVIAATRLT